MMWNVRFWIGALWRPGLTWSWTGAGRVWARVIGEARLVRWTPLRYLETEGTERKCETQGRRWRRRLRRPPGSSNETSRTTQMPSAKSRKVCGTDRAGEGFLIRVEWALDWRRRLHRLRSGARRHCEEPSGEEAVHHPARREWARAQGNLVLTSWVRRLSTPLERMYWCSLRGVGLLIPFLVFLLRS